MKRICKKEQFAIISFGMNGIILIVSIFYVPSCLCFEVLSVACYDERGGYYYEDICYY